MITKEMTIKEIFSKFPHKSQKLAQTMTSAGLNCTSCSAATWETLEAGVKGHGFSDSVLEDLIAKLNAILEEESDPTTITITPKAAEKFRQFAKEEGHEDCSLRFGDTAGGCGGFQYILDFCDEGTDKDAVFVSEGIKIHVEKQAVSRLTGCIIDYVDALHGAGFKISNPNVKSSCGCGSSQNY
jgi:iron-sulfur cluster assembly accessory protein